MSNWRPLFKRDEPDPVLDSPEEGLPDYLFQPIASWVRPRFYTDYDHRNGAVRDEALRDLQLRFKTSLHWGEGERGALLSLTRKMQADREFALDVVDYMLFHFDEFVAPNGLAEKALAELKQILLAGGSAWEITRGPGGADGYFALTKRSAGPMREVLDALAPSERAHRGGHFRTA